MSKSAVEVATVAGIGRVPLIPGTVGSLVGVALYLVLYRLVPSWPWYGLVVAVLFGLGVWITGAAEQELGEHDDQRIVWDEVVGFLVAMTALSSHWRVIIAAFVLFRLCDMAKPFRIHLLQKLPGGWGVMLDDVAAGGLTAIVLHVLFSMLGW